MKKFLNMLAAVLLLGTAACQWGTIQEGGSCMTEGDTVRGRGGEQRLVCRFNNDRLEWVKE